ncbi:unnamed protein product [Cladocopium goreaui]|uniref:MPN domain-containing protein n=1 Tax=Cladocopium goreaui TaxID=2562237 RepID=A0A9P1BTY6_9DINO|nr:unnamed protein product [Cladocopium goreaui]
MRTLPGPSPGELSAPPELGATSKAGASAPMEVPFFSELTVSETVIFAAQLEGLSLRKAALVAEKLLNRLRSGGEQRRLALACALAGEDDAAQLKALLADEPTTGLDTFQAAEMVQLLAELGQSRQCATIMTIHQPRSSVWAMIEDVLLLGPGGRAVFCGSRTEILEQLAALGHACPREGVNPADFIIDLISVHSEGAQVDEDHRRIASLAENLARAKRAVARPPGAPSLTPPAPHSSTSPWRAFHLLVRRAWLQTSRDKGTNFSRLLATGGLGFIFGAQFGFFAPDDMTAVSVTSRVGLLSFGAISMAFIGEMRALDRFAKEKKVVSRERASGFYSGFTYLCAKAVAELPSDAMFACFFAFVLHCRCGLRVPLNELMAVYCLLAVVCAALGLAIGAAIPNPERAMTAGIPIMTVHMLTGVIDPAGSAAAQPSPSMVMLRSISPIRYAIEAKWSSRPAVLSPQRLLEMAGNFNLQRILGNMPGMAGGGGQQQEDAALADTAEQVYISSLALLKMLKHGRAGVPMEVMGLMLGEFIDDYTVRVVDVFSMPQSGNSVSVEAVDPVFQAKMLDMLKQTGRPEMVVGWYHSHPGFGCWFSGTDINTQQSFEQLNPRAVGVVVDPIQSVKGKVVIDCFRLINHQMLMLGQEPRQTTSNIGHLNKPSITALIHGHYYSIAINYRKNDLEQKMLLNLGKKKWQERDGLKLTDFDSHEGDNEKTVKEMLDLTEKYNKMIQEEFKSTEDEFVVNQAGGATQKCLCKSAENLRATQLQ